MRVSEHQKGRARSTEAAFERRFAAALTSAGIWSRHMADRYSGLPDRYVQGARWIEFKSIKRVRGGFTIGEGMTEAKDCRGGIGQREVARELCAAGEQVWLCSLLDDGKVKNISFIPFRSVDEKWGRPMNMGAYVFVDDCSAVVRAYFL